MHQLPDSYRYAADAQEILARLVLERPEFGHLTQARVLCVLSERQPMLHGNPCIAHIGAPSVQGPYSWLFDWLLERFLADPLENQTLDYLVLIDAALWPTFDDVQRERLIYHELCHLQPKEDTHGRGIRLGNDGRPLLKVVPHDIEAFDEEIRRYGPRVVGIEDTCVAIADGLAAERARDTPKLRVAGGRRRG
jgi:hypothetical protein